MEKFLRNLHENMTRTRNRLLSWMETDNFEGLSKVKAVADAYKKDFFEKVMAETQVSTIILWANNFQQFENVIPTKYYDYVTSSCKIVESHAIHGDHEGKKMYNASCSDNLDDLWNSKPLGITPFSVGMPKDGVNTLRKIWNKPDSIPATYLFVIKDAVTLRNGDAWVGATKIVIQRCYQDKKPTLPANWEKAKLYKEVFAITQTFGGSFYHFHVEVLPRLMPYLKWLEDNPSIKILITEAKYGSAFDHLIKILKVPRERFITDKIVRAKVLYMPAGSFNLFGIAATSLYIKSRFESLPAGEPNSVVFIKRSSRGRLWKYHNEIFKEVKKVVEERGFKLVLFADNPAPSFEDSMKIFSKALIVLGPHGAGLTHLLWTRPGTVVIEGLCDIVPRRVNLCYRNLAQMLGLRWYGIYHGCVSTSTSQVKPIVQHYLDKFMKSFTK